MIQFITRYFSMRREQLERRKEIERKHAEAVAQLEKMIADTRAEADEHDTQGRRITAQRLRLLADEQEMRMQMTLLSKRQRSSAGQWIIKPSTETRP